MHHLVREDQQALFGFATTEELAFFELLMTVSQVGPAARAGDHGRTPGDASSSSRSSPTTSTCTPAVSGVGRKTAQRIILELKEKVHAAGIAVGPGHGSDSTSSPRSSRSATRRRRRAVRRGPWPRRTESSTLRIKAALQELASARADGSGRRPVERPGRRRAHPSVVSGLGGGRLLLEPVTPLPRRVEVPHSSGLRGRAGQPRRSRRSTA